MQNRRVLIVDDDPNIVGTLRSYLKARGHDLIVRNAIEEVVDLLRYEDIDLVITELSVGGASGLEICRQVAQSYPHLPVIVFAARSDVRDVSAAIRAGASDYVLKSSGLNALNDAVHRSVSATSRRTFRPIVSPPRHFLSYEHLIGRSGRMRVVHELIARAAPTDVTIFITGESGTGKELVARAVHAASRRVDESFVAVGCAELSEDLLNIPSGTLFLDEICALSPGLQLKLLRAIEETSLGVRLIVATSCSIEREVEAGRFRADLFYRLHIVPMEVPPLRERGRDVEELVWHFIEIHGGGKVRSISIEAIEKLFSYPYPGNVRELEEIIRHCCAQATSEELQVTDLPTAVAEHVGTQEPSDRDIDGWLSMEVIEQQHILDVLDAVGGNQTQAAQVLDINRKTLAKKMRMLKRPN